MDESARYSAESLHRLATQLASAAGVPADDADLLAEVLVDADLHGISTHGISRLPIYLRRVESGLIDARGVLAIEHDFGAVVRFDAGNGLGPVQATKVVDRIGPRAMQHGVCLATVRRSNHCGALSWYSRRAAARGFILIATSNGEPGMAPDGVIGALIGTNPLAVCFPTGRESPLDVDLATSLVARGNIITAERRGQAIPETWAVDEEGFPTTDPTGALRGSTRPMAGHKGYALALAVEALSGVLSGSAFGRGVGSMYRDFDRPQDVGHFFLMIRIGAVMDEVQFIARLNTLIDSIKSAPRRSDVPEVRVPGERSTRTATLNRTRGIVVDEATIGELRELCGRYGLPFEPAGPV